MASGFETRSVTLQHGVLLTVLAPVEDVERIMAAVTALDPLRIGAYDGNAHVTAAGTEQYRPRGGAAVGAEPDLRRRPGVVKIAFEIPDDQGLLEEVVEAVFQVHSDQESVVRLQSILSSRSKRHDDKGNPNRWCNTTGDRKGRSAA